MKFEKVDAGIKGYACIKDRIVYNVESRENPELRRVVFDGRAIPSGKGQATFYLVKLKKLIGKNTFPDETRIAAVVRCGIVGSYDYHIGSEVEWEDLKEIDPERFGKDEKSDLTMLLRIE